MRIDQFPPIPATPMVIKSEVMSTGAVFSRSCSKRCRVGPDGLHALSMCQSYSVHQREAERDLAAHTMANQMKLGYGDTPVAKFLKIEGQWRCVGLETLLKICTPLTCNIVRNEEAFDPSFDVCSNRRGKYIVCVYVPGEQSNQF